MSALMESIQVTFSRDEVDQLEALARIERQSLDSLIRRAVREKYFGQPVEDRLEAVRRMEALRLPVADWQQMEEEATRDS